MYWNNWGKLNMVYILDSNDSIGSDFLVDLMELCLGRKLSFSLKFGKCLSVIRFVIYF